jgi:hypothetical protein
MRKGLLFLGSFLMLLLFAGGMLFLLGAQHRDPLDGGAQTGVNPADPKPALNPGYSSTRRLTIEQILQTSSDILYAISKQRGFLVSFDLGESWVEHNNGLPRRVVYPFDEASARVRNLTSLNVDPLQEARVAVTTSDRLYLSEDYGSTWQQIPIGKPLRSTSYLTSVALSPRDPDTLLVGTSFNGFFETTDRGGSWHDPSLSARFLYRGAGFYEEVSGLSYHPSEEGVIYFSCGFGHGLYRGSPDRKSWTRLDFPGDGNAEKIYRLEMLPSGAGWQLGVQTHSNRWHFSLAGSGWTRSQTLATTLLAEAAASRQEDPFRRERIRTASNRFGIYVSSYRAQGEDLDNHLRFIKENGMNSLVVDCKDDRGWIAYDTQLEFPRKIGAVNKRFALDELLHKAHELDIYVIARLVVFKDRQLYNYNGFEYAVWNGKSDQPWRYIVKVEVPPEPDPAEQNGGTAGNGGTGQSPDSEAGNGGNAGAEAGKDAAAAESEEPEPVYKYVQKEYWVDPYNPKAWSYNLAIAEELQRRGVDEIQFDYIRFPSDGNLSRIEYRYRREGMSPIDALESFLTQAREVIHIPISTDLYGFNSWHRMGNWIGQSIDVLADHVDVICPMFYPSHFPRDFMKEEPYLDRAGKIYQEGSTRAAFMVGSRSIVRPYVQAFLIGGELAMGPAEYSQYLTNQIEGTLAAPSSGLTLWNASNHYYMVLEPLAPYFEQ